MLYVIRNERTMRVLVGESVDGGGRLRQYRHKLRRGYYRNSKTLGDLQRDYDRHGEESFEFIIRGVGVVEEELETYAKRGYGFYNQVSLVEGVACPDAYRGVVMRVISMLENGMISVERLNRGLDEL